MTGVIIFIVAILALIMVHEAGHLTVAKVYGFKAPKYFLGFGPTLWSTQKGETEYGIKAFPLGGFVKIIGMNPYEPVPPEDAHRAYSAKPKSQRALLLLAGSAMHWPFAFLILLVTAMTIGFPTGNVTTEVSLIETEVKGEGTAAAQAGLLPDDKIVAVGGQPTDSWQDVRSYIQSHAGETATFTIERNSETSVVTATPGTAIFSEAGVLVAYAPPGEEIRDPKPGETVGGFMGIQPSEEFKRENLFGAIGKAGDGVWRATTAAVYGMKETGEQVFGGELWDALWATGERQPDEGPLGLVGGARLASESVSRGRYFDLIGLIVVFTIFVGLMNLLPLPPLDGGHLAVVGWEAITRKPVDVRKLIPVAAIVISFFVLLFIAVLYLDVARPIRVPF